MTIPRMTLPRMALPRMTFRPDSLRRETRRRGPLRSVPSLAFSALLAGTALLALPAGASAGSSEISSSSAPPSRSADAVHLVFAQNDVVMDENQDDEQDPAMTAGTSDRGDSWQSRAGGGWDHGSNGSHDDGNRGDGRQGDGRHGDGYGDGRSWEHGRSVDHGMAGDRWGGRGGGSPDEGPMMAMHDRMMRMMQGARGPAAGFRIEMGTTKMAVRCSPRETMRDCVDAALSLVNRLRDATSGARTTVPKDSSSAPATGSGPGAPGTSGSGTGPGNTSSGNSSAQ